MQRESSFDIGAAVAAAKSTLTIPPPALGQPVLVVLCGLPGTGKSTLARRLADALPAVIIESDRVRQRLFAPPTYTAEESQQVHQVCHILIDWYLRHLGGKAIKVGPLDAVLSNGVSILFFKAKGEIPHSDGSSVDHIGFSYPDIAS